ncbi:MAG TPA: phosphoribosylformylglycinamidine synthase II, partial [Novosphingobium sp.]|nr:phosphoribosylformylglycinamidine synthase II [Novosphingobium sp.]
GGLLVAIAEMALAGNIGAELDGMNAGLAFGEAQSRYVVALPDADALDGLGLPLMRIGKTGGSALQVNGKPIPLTTLRETSDSFFRDWMEG